MIVVGLVLLLVTGPAWSASFSTFRVDYPDPTPRSSWRLVDDLVRQARPDAPDAPSANVYGSGTWPPRLTPSSGEDTRGERVRPEPRRRPRLEPVELTPYSGE